MSGNVCLREISIARDKILYINNLFTFKTYNNKLVYIQEHIFLHQAASISTDLKR